jgi:hypothetical protein
MNKLDEYLRHADECREMARIAQPAHRLQLEQMAATWEQLADARKRQLAKAGETASGTADEPGQRQPATERTS